MFFRVLSCSPSVFSSLSSCSSLQPFKYVSDHSCSASYYVSFSSPHLLLQVHIFQVHRVMLSRILTEVLCTRTWMVLFKNKLLRFSIIPRLCWAKHTLGVLWWFNCFHCQDGHLTGLCCEHITPLYFCSAQWDEYCLLILLWKLS